MSIEIKSLLERFLQTLIRVFLKLSNRSSKLLRLVIVIVASMVCSSSSGGASLLPIPLRVCLLLELLIEPVAAVAVVNSLLLVSLSLLLPLFLGCLRVLFRCHLVI
jgi:hypothetical protein